MKRFLLSAASAFLAVYGFAQSPAAKVSTEILRQSVSIPVHTVINQNPTNPNGTLPTGITDSQVYYVIGQTTNTFQVSTATNGTAVDFTTNGSGFSYYVLSQPRCRFISYLFDTVFAGGDDGNPSTIYQSETQAATADTLTFAVAVI